MYNLCDVIIEMFGNQNEIDDLLNKAFENDVFQFEKLLPVDENDDNYDCDVTIEAWGTDEEPKCEINYNRIEYESISEPCYLVLEKLSKNYQSLTFNVFATHNCAGYCAAAIINRGEQKFFMHTTLMN